MRIFGVVSTCEAVQANTHAGFMEKETAKVVAYEHIAEILKGGHNDKAGS